MVIPDENNSVQCHFPHDPVNEKQKGDYHLDMYISIDTQTTEPRINSPAAITTTAAVVPEFCLDALPEIASKQAVIAWCHSFKELVSQLGFERAFKRHIRDIARIANNYDVLIQQFISQWLEVDPITAPIVQQHHRDVLSKQDLRTGRCPDGSSLFRNADRDGVPGVVERDGSPVKVFCNEQFQNWSETVSFPTSYTFVPKTQLGVVNIVKFALDSHRRVRVSGIRHSSAPVFGGTDDIMISMMDMRPDMPQDGRRPPNDSSQDNELESVTFDGTFTAEDGSRHARIRLGAAATGEHFRQWALSSEQDGGDWQWMICALPSCELTTNAGWTQPICHGAEITHKSMSDLCLEMTIVNCKGELQTISDKQQMRAVAGSFGMLGVVVSQVFVMDRMKIAQLFPQKINTMLSVPPVERSDVPTQKDLRTDFSDSQLKEAELAFERDANKYHSEWVWFPFQDECWLNSWDATAVGDGRPVYPDAKAVENQDMQASISRLFEVTLLRFLPDKVHAKLLGSASMSFLPTGSLPTSVSEALHLRPGIHRMPLRATEISIEIPGTEDGKPDFSICRKAWWHAISEKYQSLEERGEVPVRTAVEMRILGDSDTLLSPQRGNVYGTCVIEVLTNTLVEEEEWKKFVERLVARWETLRNPVTGETLRVRPHWAKEWPRKMSGEDVIKFLGRAYEGVASKFLMQMQRAAEDGGYELSDAFRVFANDTMLGIIQEHS